MRWQRSCFKDRQKTSRGERELRGERHGKGGRSLLLTTASSFFIPLLCACVGMAWSATPAQGQVRLEAKFGYAVSGPVVKDQVATPILRARLGRGVDESVTASFTPAPQIGLGLQIPVHRALDAVITGSWSPTRLRVTDGSGSRDVQSVSVLEGVLGLRRTIRNSIEAGGGFGAARFTSDDRALFRGGAAIAPLVEGAIGTGWNTGVHRVHVRAIGQMHRFGTRAILDEGGHSGNVFRITGEASFTWKGGVTQ